MFNSTEWSSRRKPYFSNLYFWRDFAIGNISPGLTVKVVCKVWVWYEIHALHWKRREKKVSRRSHCWASINKVGGRDFSKIPTPTIWNAARTVQWNVTKCLEKVKYLWLSISVTFKYALKIKVMILSRISLCIIIFCKQTSVYILWS